MISLQTLIIDRHTNINMNSCRFILFFVLFTILTLCIPEKTGEGSKTVQQPEQKQEFDIEVSVASSQLSLEQFQTRFFKINEIGRNKRSAYAKFIRKYEKFIGILTQNLFIPCKQAMIQTGIQMGFVGKKDQWQFSKQVALRIDIKERNKLQKIISTFKLTPLKSEHLIQDIQIKSKVIELFLIAKHRAQQISQIQYHGDMQVANLNVFHIESLKRYNQSCSEFQSAKFLLALKYTQGLVSQNGECEGQPVVKELSISFKFALAKSTPFQIQSEYEEQEDESGWSSQEMDREYSSMK